MSDLELLKNINDIDDDLICEAEQWKPRKAKRLRLAVVAAAAAILCLATAVTAIASIKPPKEVIYNDEPLELVDYNVYTNERGHEIRTYVFNMPDYVLGEEIEGSTPVGRVRVVERDDNRWGGWEILDEEGNVFHWGINNQKIIYDIIYPDNPRESHYGEFGTVNALSNKENTVYYFDEYYDGDSIADKISIYVFRYDDKETARRLMEEHGYEFIEEIFDDNVELHKEYLLRHAEEE